MHGDEPKVDAAGYTVGAVLGHGSFATVYAARDVRHGRPVALKVLRGDHPRWAERFRREFAAASEIDDEHVVRVYERGETDDGRAFIAMEYIEGRSVREALRGGRALGAARAVAIAAQVARGLAAIHAQGIAHRDVKPANIMLRGDGDGDEHAVLVDFGLALGMGDPRLTVAGFTGTMAYASPEQRMGQHPRPPSDLYQLGLVLFEMLVGHLGAGLATRDEVPPGATFQTPVPLHLLNGLVPESLVRLITGLLATTPRDRPGGALSVALQLESIDPGVIGSSPAERPVTVPASGRPTHVRVAAVAAGLLLLLGGVALFVPDWGSAPPPQRRGHALTSPDAVPDAVACLPADLNKTTASANATFGTPDPEPGEPRRASDVRTPPARPASPTPGQSPRVARCTYTVTAPVSAYVVVGGQRHPLPYTRTVRRGARVPAMTVYDQNPNQYLPAQTSPRPCETRSILIEAAFVR